MTNCEIKEKIRDRVSDEEVLDNIIVLEGDEYADGAIGLTEDNRLVYSYDRLVKSLARAYNKDNPEQGKNDAIDWLEYNTLRAIPYLERAGFLAPVIIHEFN